MRIQQIRYFLALAEELHFWNTAERLHTSQSTLSRQIQSLEDDLGFPLFERDKRNVKLTAAGMFLKKPGRNGLSILTEAGCRHKKLAKECPGW